MSYVHPLIANPEFLAFKKKLETGGTIVDRSSGEAIKIDDSSTDRSLILLSESGELVRRFHPAFFGMIELFDKFK